MCDPRPRRRSGRLKRSSRRSSSGRARTTRRPPRRIGIPTALAYTSGTRNARVASSAAAQRAGGLASAPSSDDLGRGTPRSAPPDSHHARRAARASGAPAGVGGKIGRYAGRLAQPFVAVDRRRAADKARCQQSGQDCAAPRAGRAAPRVGRVSWSPQMEFLRARREIIDPQARISAADPRDGRRRAAPGAPAAASASTCSPASTATSAQSHTGRLRLPVDCANPHQQRFGAEDASPDNRLTARR